MSSPAPPVSGVGAMGGAFGPRLSRRPFWTCSPQMIARGATAPGTVFAALAVRGGGVRRPSK
eukprot:1682745-Lingulodinium_polyedra.AAC.1